MCQITTNNFARVAKHDITVYKVMLYNDGENMIESPYMSTYYILNEEYHKPFLRSEPVRMASWIKDHGLGGVAKEDSLKQAYPRCRYFIEIGFHSFKKKKDAQDLCDIFNSYDLSRNRYKKVGVFRCVISKGSLYYPGKCDISSSRAGTTHDLRESYCSDTIKVVCKV